MDALEIRYLLKRARAHRLLGQAAKCNGARSVHRQFVRDYQDLLVAIRCARMSARIPLATPQQRRLGAFDRNAAMAAGGKMV